MTVASLLRLALLLAYLLYVAAHFSDGVPGADAGAGGRVRWRRAGDAAAASEGAPPPVAGAPAPAVDWAARLRAALLPTYDRQTRPVADRPTNVSLGLVVNHVALDERTATFTTHGWVQLRWEDPRLRWDPAEYGGIDILHIADHEIWQPDITLYNSASGSTVDNYGNTLALLYANGKVLWVPPTVLSVFCPLDLRRWPRDEHECALRFGSWTYDANKINLTQADREVEEEQDEEVMRGAEGGRWRVVGVRSTRAVQHYACCAEPYVHLTFYVSAVRRGRALLAATLSPAAALALLLLSATLLPPRSRPPPLLAACLAAVLFLVHFARALPAMADHTPHIVMGYCGLVWVSCLWAASSAAAAAMGGKRTAAPAWLRRLVTARACSLLVAPPPVAAAADADVDGGGKGDAERAADVGGAAPADGTWRRAAAAFDRVAILAGLLLLFVIAIRAAL